MNEVLEFKARLLSICASIEYAANFDDFDMKVWTYLYHLIKKIVDSLNRCRTIDEIATIAKQFHISEKDDEIDRYRDLVIYYIIANITDIDSGQNVDYPLVNYNDDICPMDIFINIYNYRTKVNPKNYDFAAATLYIF